MSTLSEDQPVDKLAYSPTPPMAGRQRDHFARPAIAAHRRGRRRAPRLGLRAGVRDWQALFEGDFETLDEPELKRRLSKMALDAEGSKAVLVDRLRHQAERVQPFANVAIGEPEGLPMEPSTNWPSDARIGGTA